MPGSQTHQHAQLSMLPLLFLFAITTITAVLVVLVVTKSLHMVIHFSNAILEIQYWPHCMFFLPRLAGVCSNPKWKNSGYKLDLVIIFTEDKALDCFNVSWLFYLIVCIFRVNQVVKTAAVIHFWVQVTQFKLSYHR